MQVDLSSQRSVRSFADEVHKNESRIDILIHNAGFAGAFRRNKSVDGIEFTMATNHYGPFLLTHLLIDLVKRAESARIIVVASWFYALASVNLNNLNPINFAFPAHLYSVSKCANVLFTLELARRLKDTNITVNCLHPGTIDTGIWRNMPFPLDIPFKLIRRCFKTPLEGAQTTIYLATSDEVAGKSGKYFSDSKESSLNRSVQNKDYMLQFWEASKKITHMTLSDPQI